MMPCLERQIDGKYLSSRTHRIEKAHRTGRKDTIGSIKRFHPNGQGSSPDFGKRNV